MLKVAALCDVHGNVPALEAVLTEVPDAALIVVGGDTAGGPWPSEVLDRLRGFGDRVRWVRGNADVTPPEEVVTSDEERQAIEWNETQLSAEQKEFLASLPLTLVVEVDGLGEVLFCHGTPRSDREIVTAVTSDERLRRILEGVEPRTIVGGHVHHQFERKVGGYHWINAGSVGMAYEGRPGAFWALLGPDVEFRRTEYDVESMVAAMRETDYPGAENQTELLLTDIPTPEFVADYFERQALEQAAS